MLRRSWSVPVLVALLATISKAADTPAGVAPGWSVKPDPPSVPTTIPKDATPAITVPGGEGVLYPTSASPFVLVGNNAENTAARQVYDLRTSQPVGAPLRGKIEISDNARVSPDGEFLIDVGPLSNSEGIVRVWSMKTGTFVKDLPVTKGPKFVGFLDFAGPGQVAYSDLNDKSVAIWNIASGSKAREIVGMTGKSEDAAFSPGRKYVATAGLTDKHVKIYDLKVGVLAGDVALPPPGDGGSLSLVHGLRFSPDGTELAALVSEGRRSRLLAWNLADGKLVVDHSFAGDPKHMSPGAFSYKGNLIEWLPDGSAWLLAGHVVVDRNGGRPVWLFRTAVWFKDMGPRRMIDNDRMLACTGPDRAKRLEVVTLPWPTIDAALKQIDDPAVKAAVRPGGSVSLKIEVAKVLHGDAAATRDELEKILTARLAADGITVAEDMPTVFRAKYSEAKGETLHEMKPGAGPFPSPFNGTPTGRTVQATQGVCTMSWEVAGKKAPLWTGKVAYNPSSMRIQGDLNDAKAREASFQQMVYTLAGEAIPYFLTDSTPPVMLPGTTELKDTPAKKATNRATSKPTTRGQTTAPDDGAAPKSKVKRIR